MRVLCSFPGRAGDLLWALPSIRAVSEHVKVPVDLLIAGEFAGMVPLLEQQPYLDRIVADAAWNMSHAWQPPNREDVISPYDRVYHLGYRGWPAKPLPFETQDTLAMVWDLEDGPIPEIDLGRAWIVSTPFEDAVGDPYPAVAGWSDCWFELKYGLCRLLATSVGEPFVIVVPDGSRWGTETLPCRHPVIYQTDWMAAARFIASAKVFLGDCSALHVLAVALGKPALLVEPMEARHNDIFYPLGKTGRVRLLTGNDGQPTNDARHCADALKEMLHAQS